MHRLISVSYSKFFVPAPIVNSAVQDVSDESSFQFDSSSSEETRLRYVIKIITSRKEFRDNNIEVEVCDLLIRLIRHFSHQIMSRSRRCRLFCVNSFTSL